MAIHTSFTQQTSSGKSRYMTAVFDVSEDDDLTGSIDLQDFTLVGVIMPATWTAADITFEGSVDDTTFNPIKSKSGIVYTLTVAASEYIQLPVTETFLFPRFLKLASSQPQAGDRTITLLLKI